MWKGAHGSSSGGGGGQGASDREFHASQTWKRETGRFLATRIGTAGCSVPGVEGSVGLFFGRRRRAERRKSAKNGFVVEICPEACNLGHFAHFCIGKTQQRKCEMLSKPKKIESERPKDDIEIRPFFYVGNAIFATMAPRGRNSGRGANPYRLHLSRGHDGSLLRNPLAPVKGPERYILASSVALWPYT